MASPFEKMLYAALKKSSDSENLLLKEANKIIGKGYPEAEIIDILVRFQKGLLDPAQVEIVTDTLEELTEDEDW